MSLDPLLAKFFPHPVQEKSKAEFCLHLKASGNSLSVFSVAVTEKESLDP